MGKGNAGALKLIVLLMILFGAVIVSAKIGLDGNKEEVGVTTQEYLDNVGKYLLEGDTGNTDINTVVSSNTIRSLSDYRKKDYEDFTDKRSDILYKLYKDSEDSITRVVILEYLIELDTNSIFENADERAYTSEIAEKISKELVEDPEKILKHTIELDGIESEYGGFKKALLKQAISNNTDLVRGSKDENLKYLDILGLDY